MYGGLIRSACFISSWTGNGKKAFELKKGMIKVKHMHEIDIMDIGGFKIGQAEDTKGLTGCTVFLFDKQSPAGVDIREADRLRGRHHF